MNKPSRNETKGLRTLDVVRALAAGPALACVGYLIAIMEAARSGSRLEPFTREFVERYSGFWIVLGTIGFVLGIIKLVSLRRAK